MLLRTDVLKIAPLLLLLAAVPARAGDLNAYATCTGPGEVSLTWEFWEYPGGAVGRPEWVGYDMMRRSVADCGDWVRLNPEIVPRIVGQTHGGVFVDASAGSSVTWEYRVVPVDAAHQPVIMLSPDCEPPCVPLSWASCPEASAPIALGRVTDHGQPGGFIFIEPCAGSCWGSFYLGGPLLESVRPYAGTGTVLRFFGVAGCGSVEGCALEVQAFEVSNCSITTAPTPSWGQLKLRYH